MNVRVAALGLAAVIFAVDRATKIWIQSSFSEFDVWTVIPGLLDIVHSENPGMAFGMLADHDSPWRALLLIGVSLAILIFLARLLWKSDNAGKRQPVALALVMGGAMGNLYDRILRGSVTDFIDIHVSGYHWPTFNVADSAITVGAILLALDLWFTRDAPAESRHAAAREQ